MTRIRVRLHRDGSVDVWHGHKSRWVASSPEVAQRLAKKFNLKPTTPPPLSVDDLEESKCVATQTSSNTSTPPHHDPAPIENNNVRETNRNIAKNQTVKHPDIFKVSRPLKCREPDLIAKENIAQQESAPVHRASSRRSVELGVQVGKPIAQLSPASTAADEALRALRSLQQKARRQIEISNQYLNRRLGKVDESTWYSKDNKLNPPRVQSSNKHTDSVPAPSIGNQSKRHLIHDSQLKMSQLKQFFSFWCTGVSKQKLEKRKLQVVLSYSRKSVMKQCWQRWIKVARLRPMFHTPKSSRIPSKKRTGIVRVGARKPLPKSLQPSRINKTRRLNSGKSRGTTLQGIRTHVGNAKGSASVQAKGAAPQHQTTTSSFQFQTSKVQQSSTIEVSRGESDSTTLDCDQNLAENMPKVLTNEANSVPGAVDSSPCSRDAVGDLNAEASTSSDTSSKPSETWSTGPRAMTRTVNRGATDGLPQESGTLSRRQNIGKPKKRRVKKQQTIAVPAEVEEPANIQSIISPLVATQASKTHRKNQPDSKWVPIANRMDVARGGTKHGHLVVDHHGQSTVVQHVQSAVDQGGKPTVDQYTQSAVNQDGHSTEDHYGHSTVDQDEQSAVDQDGKPTEDEYTQSTVDQHAQNISGVSLKGQEHLFQPALDTPEEIGGKVEVNKNQTSPPLFRGTGRIETLISAEKNVTETELLGTGYTKPVAAPRSKARNTEQYEHWSPSTIDSKTSRNRDLVWNTTVFQSPMESPTWITEQPDMAKSDHQIHNDQIDECSFSSFVSLQSFDDADKEKEVLGEYENVQEKMRHFSNGYNEERHTSTSPGNEQISVPYGGKRSCEMVENFFEQSVSISGGQIEASGLEKSIAAPTNSVLSSEICHQAILTENASTISVFELWRNQSKNDNILAMQHFQLLMKRSYFSKWRSCWLQSQQLAHRVFQIGNRSLLFRCWKRWKKLVEAVNATRKLLRQMKLKNALQHWRVKVEQQREEMQLVIVERWTRQRMLRWGLTGLRTHYQKIRGARDVFCRVRLQISFSCWERLAVFSRAVESVDGTVCRMQMRHALYQLKKYTAQAFANSVLAEGHRRKILCSGMFNNWRSFASKSTIEQWKKEEVGWSHYRNFRLKLGLDALLQWRQDRMDHRKRALNADEFHRCSRLYRALEQLQQNMTRRKRLQIASRAVVATRKRSIMKDFLNTWNSAAEQMICFRLFRIQAVQKMHFHRWVIAVRKMSARLEFVKRVEEFRNTKLKTKMFHALRKCIDDKEGLRKAIVHMEAYRIRKSLSWWSNWKQVRRTKRDIDSLVLIFWRKRKISLNFRRWSKHVKSVQRNVKLKTIALSWGYHLKGQAFATWMEFMYLHRKVQLLSPIAEQQLRKNTKHRAIQSLQTFTRNKRWQRYQLAVASQHWVLSSLESSLRWWFEWSRERRRRHEAMELSNLWWRRKTLLGAFGAWIEVVVGEEKVRSMNETESFSK